MKRNMDNIKQFAKQADIEYTDKLEKYTKLVLEECSRIVLKDKIELRNELVNIQGAFQAGRTVASVQIRDHFELCDE